MQHATIIASLIDNPFLGLPLSFFIDKHWQTQSCFHQMTIIQFNCTQSVLGPITTKYNIDEKI